MTRARIATLYFALQSVLIVAWWSVLVVSPGARLLFEAGNSPSTLNAFAPGDACIVALGLYVGARRGHGSSASIEWMVTGAMSYAAFYTITLAIRHQSSPLGAILMTSGAMASVWAAAVLSRRASPSAPTCPGS
jgi:hypothetical protein